MNNLASLIGISAIFAVGFYSGHHTEATTIIEPIALEKLPIAKDSTIDNTEQSRVSMALASLSDRGNRMPARSRPTPPHELTLHNPVSSGQATVELMDQVKNRHAEMLASMRANNLPKEHIEQIELKFAAQEEALASQGLETPSPLIERSPEEIAAELQQSLEASGAPKSVVDAKLEQLTPSIEHHEETISSKPLPAHQRIPG